jgi:hypothetical protein
MSQDQLREIVDVQITRETLSVTRVGFGTGLVLTAEADLDAGELKPYSSPQELAADTAVFGGSATDTDVYQYALKYFGQQLRPLRLLVGVYDPEEPGDSVNAVIESADWYALMVIDDDDGTVNGRTYPQRIALIADTVEASQKLFFPEINSDLDPSLVALTLLNAQNYDRTAVLYQFKDDLNGAPAAWLGRMLPTDPGSNTWAYKGLAGVSANAGIEADALTTAQRDSILDLNGNIYTRIADLPVTRNGTVMSGEWIDVMRGIDWLTQRLSERLFNLLANAPKVPYTDGGIGLVENEVRAQLQIAQERGVIAPDTEDGDGFTVTVPRVVDTSEQDRADRFLRDVRFDARLAGAVHTIQINGRVAP